MQSLDRLIINELNAIDALDEGFSDEFDDFLEDAIDEALQSVSVTPRVLTYTTRDVIDDRISIPAQHALVRLSKNSATSTDAVGMLEEIKAGRLAGIYCVNWKKSAQRALKLGSNWWTVIPQGEDAVLMVDPDDLWDGPPLMAFRRELDPDCGLLQGEQRFQASPSRLDAALLRVWQTYLSFRQGEVNCFSTQIKAKVLPLLGISSQSAPKKPDLVCGPTSSYQLLNEPIPTAFDEKNGYVKFQSSDFSVYGKTNLRTDEVRQGYVATCPIPAILAAMAHTNRFRKSMIKEESPRCVMSLRKLRQPDSTTGLEWEEYRTKRYFDVYFRTQPTVSVSVTDLFYFDNYGQLRYARSTNQRLWVSIIEKAYAAFRGGSNGYGGNYENLRFPVVEQAMKDLCGLDYQFIFSSQQVWKAGSLLKTNFDSRLRQVLIRARSIPTIAGRENHVLAVIGMSQRNIVTLYDAGKGQFTTEPFNDFRNRYEYVWSAP